MADDTLVCRIKNLRYGRMPKIDPTILSDVLVSYEMELYEIYLKCKNTELSDDLLSLHCKLLKLITQVQSIA